MNFPFLSAYTMTLPAIIRPMRQDDLDQVVAIDQLSFSLPWPRSAYQFELRENPASDLWVAEIQHPDGGARVVGVGVVWLVLDEAHIATLAVHPDFRRKAIGRRLLYHALQASLQKGARQAMLEVRAGNQAAIALYRHFGFEIAGRRPRYYRDNQEDALLMNLRQLDRDYLDRLAGGEIDVEVTGET